MTSKFAATGKQHASVDYGKVSPQVEVGGNMVNIFSRVEASDLESKETISLTPPGRVSQQKMQNPSYKKVTNKLELKGNIENIKTENSKMDDSDIMIEERRHKTELVTPIESQAPLVSQKMEIEIVS